MLAKNSWKLLFAVIALIFCISLVRDTFAKYTESKTGSTDFTIANWSILVNNQDITETATLSSFVTPIYDANANIANGVIAPGSTGYFDLNIDASDTEVSFQYTISVSNATDSDVEDLKITGYELDGGNLVTVGSSIDNFSQTILYGDSDKTRTLRIYFAWFEGAGEAMDNASDTNASISGGSGKIRVDISFVQVVS